MLTVNFLLISKKEKWYLRLIRVQFGQYTKNHRVGKSTPAFYAVTSIKNKTKAMWAPKFISGAIISILLRTNKLIFKSKNVYISYYEKQAQCTSEWSTPKSISFSNLVPLTVDLFILCYTDKPDRTLVLFWAPRRAKSLFYSLENCFGTLNGTTLDWLVGKFFLFFCFFFLGNQILTIVFFFE